MKKILVLAALLATVSTSAFAQERPKSYDPSKGAPATVATATPAATAKPAVQAPNQRELAQQRLTTWQQTKVQCYTAAGLKQEDGDFRVNPKNPIKLQVNDRVWLQPDRYNLDALEACR